MLQAVRKCPKWPQERQNFVIGLRTKNLVHRSESWFSGLHTLCAYSISLFIDLIFLFVQLSHKSSKDKNNQNFPLIYKTNNTLDIVQQLNSCLKCTINKYKLRYDIKTHIQNETTRSDINIVSPLHLNSNLYIYIGW